LSSGISSDGQIVPFTYTVSLTAGSTVVFSVQAVPGSDQTTGLTLAVTGPLVPQIPYYFSQLAVGGGFQTTLTYINYSPQQITCVTNFYSAIGSPLSIQFSQGSVSTRTDTLQPGQSIHDQNYWQSARRHAGMGASYLHRPGQLCSTACTRAGVPVGEASVNAETAPTTEFATLPRRRPGSPMPTHLPLSRPTLR
jgi:hypothetical protein